MNKTAASELEAYDRMTHAAYRIFAEWGGGTVTEAEGLMFASGPHPKAYIVNAAFRTEPGLVGAEVLDRTRAHYEPRAFEYAVNATTHADADINAAAAEAGWQKVLTLPAMVVRHRLGEGAPPTGSALRRADPKDDRARFGDIVAACFADQAEEADAYRLLFDHPALLAGPGMSAFIASVDGEDAAIALSIVVDRAATVGWVGTLERFRRRGLGDLVTRAATNAAFDQGAQLVTLQASPLGEPVYAAMGYETISTETIWAPPSAAT